MKKIKAEQTENQQLFLDLSQNWDQRANCNPENWRDKQADPETQGLLGAKAQVQKLLVEASTP